MGVGKRNKRYEKEFRAGRCELCDGDVELEFYVERGDVVACTNCGAEYVIKALQPIRLKLIEEEPEP
jgi:alpha-aminoadipate carrier protein LysW